MTLTWREHRTSVPGELQRLDYCLSYTDQPYLGT